MPRPISILIADDSKPVREILKHIIATDPTLVLAGEATNGLEAVHLTREVKPDVIAMDVVMPGLDGLEATRRIMSETPTPIVIISSLYDPQNSVQNFEALAAGAIALLAKPTLSGDGKGEWNTLLATLKAVSRIRDPHPTIMREIPRKPIPLPQPEISGAPARVCPRLVAIGTSTGGPKALAQLFADLPADFPLPLVVVQHISPGFLEGMVNWLGPLTPLRVKIATPGEVCQPGVIYFAPDGVHTGVDRNLRIIQSNTPSLHNVRPAVTHLFQSVARNLGAASIAILLTGMGDDGARALKEIRDAGGETIAESEETALLFGMPREAIRCGAAHSVLPLYRMANYLTTYLRQAQTKWTR
ncbi:MAG TPA: chemotaxis-specific protein-glutamate methyltransferase CheB [Candidatus Sumerlaeota bacterium]|nr:chemotaxis-specific protein-glutamate methyltransferase CheB [Candidatus Sumerlaeota bacterium]